MGCTFCATGWGGFRRHLTAGEMYLREGLRPAIPLPAAANLMMATAEGRISQYVRSGFKRPPTEDWKQQWDLLMDGFFRPAITQPIPGQGSSYAHS